MNCTQPLNILFSVNYKLLNKTAERSMKNVSCGSTLVKTDIFYPPSFTLKREPAFGIPILSGMTVTLGCDVDSNPPSDHIGWLKNEKILQSNEKHGLILHNVNIRDVGWYQCTTRYFQENVSSIGEFC